MASLCWLLGILMGCMCVTASTNGSAANDMSRKNRVLDCVHLCMSGRSESPDLGGLALPLKNDDDAKLLFSIFLATLASQGKGSDSDLDRRSYAMEHFRWGKPAGHKRRPVKFFASSLEEGGSSETSFPFRIRRHLSSDKNEAKETHHEGSHQNLGLLVSRFPTRTDVPMGLQDRQEGTYRMSHFRWGSPRTSKRNGSIRKLWEETSEEKPSTLLKNIKKKWTDYYHRSCCMSLPIFI